MFTLKKIERNSKAISVGNAFGILVAKLPTDSIQKR